jgi:hypothetical protein
MNSPSGHSPSEARCLPAQSASADTTGSLVSATRSAACPGPVYDVSQPCAGVTPARRNWPGEHCTLREATHLLPESGYPLKCRYFRGFDQIPYRVNLLRYDCPQTAE